MIRKFGILFVVSLGLCLTANAVTVDECMAFYNRSQFEKSSSCFYSLSSRNKDNPSYKLYYGNSLYAQKRYANAKVQYTEIIQKYPNSAAAISAKKNLTLVDNMLKNIKTSKTNDMGNYIDEISTARWRVMPVNVWIQNGTYKASAKKAFTEWQTKTQGIVRFYFVESAKDAQITVSFLDDISHTTSGDALGITNLSIVGGKYINRAEMNIKVTTNSGAKQSTAQVYSIVLHEVGHALGVRGHSRNKYDVMYPSDDNYRNVLSNRDINTVKQIYK